MTLPYPKRLEGVHRTDELENLFRECMIKKKTGNYATLKERNDDDHPQKAAMNLLEAYDKELQQQQQQPSNTQTIHWMPIPVIQAMHTVFFTSVESTSSHNNALEDALSRTHLVFTPPPPPPKPSEETEEQRKYRKRMERLRLQQEEDKYTKLTSNLDHGTQDDEITTRSMTYAASVGLNMIVAPLSFGCFMYFFAGGLLDYVLGESFSSRTAGGTDIKRVIIGVISGVAMMFIEMILFVIRTHEFEKHSRRKQRRNRKKPFGQYSANDVSHYRDQEETITTKTATTSNLKNANGEIQATTKQIEKVKKLD